MTWEILKKSTKIAPGKREKRRRGILTERDKEASGGTRQVVKKNDGTFGETQSGSQLRPKHRKNVKTIWQGGRQGRKPPHQVTAWPEFLKNV